MAAAAQTNGDGDFRQAFRHMLRAEQQLKVAAIAATQTIDGDDNIRRALENKQRAKQAFSRAEEELKATAMMQKVAAMEQTMEQTRGIVQGGGARQTSPARPTVEKKKKKKAKASPKTQRSAAARTDDCAFAVASKGTEVRRLRASAAISRRQGRAGTRRGEGMHACKVSLQVCWNSPLCTIGKARAEQSSAELHTCEYRSVRSLQTTQCI